MVEKVLGLKADQDKPRWDLLPIEALRPIAGVLTFGARKYAPDNWRFVEGWRDRYYRAALGHIFAWRDGEWADPESGEPHLAHAGCCILFLLAMSVRKTGPVPEEREKEQVDQRSLSSKETR